MAKYIFSTLATDMRYTGWKDGGADLPSIEHSVFVKGGAGVANNRIITPLGVMTEVSDDDYEWLVASKNYVFERHVENGFIIVQDKSADADNVAADMQRGDPSKPLTDDDYTNEAVKPANAKKK